MVDLSKYQKETIGKLFDLALLPKNITEDDVRKGARDAVKYNCAAYYTNSYFWTPVAKEELAGSDVLIAAGIDFPWGVSPGIVKAFETEQAVKAGCQSLDVSINMGALRSKMYDVVLQELKDFKSAAQGCLTKGIIEFCQATLEEIATACKLIAEAGLDYAKTGTGQFEGLDMTQFLTMKETLKDTKVKLKVSGVKYPRPQNAYAFLLAGADLIGTRAAPEIIDSLDQMRAIGLVPPYTA
ncbi:MAG: deoxyribose-phosphate aldolase [Bacillota bacterium]